MAERAFGKIRIETLGPMRVAAFRAIGKEPEHVSTGYLKRWLLRQRRPGKRPVRIFGFDVELGAADQKRGLRGYEAWAPVPPGVRGSEGVRIRSAPRGLYAVLRVDDALSDPFARIPPAWQHLAGWVAANRDYALTDGLCLEEEIAERGTLHLDLYVPVAPKRRSGR